MNACHLHVGTPVLTLQVVLCAPVMMDMYWIVMGSLVMVCYYLYPLFEYLCVATNTSSHAMAYSQLAYYKWLNDYGSLSFQLLIFFQT